MKLAVVGSRGNVNRGVVHEELNILFSARRDLEEIITGGAEGVDKFAEEWAKMNNIKTCIIIPEWEKFGKPAGPIRNKIIVEKCDAIMIFWDGKSRGTKSTFDIALKERKPITMFVSGRI